MAKRNDPGLPEDDVPARSDVTVRDGAADDMIRKMMVEQRRESNLRSLPAIIPDEPEGASPKDQYARRSRLERRKAWGRVLDETPSTHFDTHHEQAVQPRRSGVARFFLRENRSGDRAEAEEPIAERRYAISLVVVSILVFWPEMIPGLLTMISWTLFVASLLFGPGRVVDFLQGLWRLFLRHHPGLAAKLRGLKDTAGCILAHHLPRKLRDRWLSGDTPPRAADRDDSFDGKLETEAYRG